MTAEFDTSLYEEVETPPAETGSGSTPEYDASMYEEATPESYAEKEQHGKMDFVYKRNKKGELVPLNRFEKMVYGLAYGGTSSVKGGEQIAGVAEETNKKDAEIMQRLRASKDRGYTIGAEVVGNVLDPVTLVIPVAKAKSLLGLAKWGAVGGGLGGSINYVEPGQSRLMNTTLGALGGAVLAPGMGAGINAYRALRGRPMMPLRDVIDVDTAKAVGLADDVPIAEKEVAGLLPPPQKEPIKVTPVGDAGTDRQFREFLGRMTPEERMKFLAKGTSADEGLAPGQDVAGLLPSPPTPAKGTKPVYVRAEGDAAYEAQLSRRLNKMPAPEAARSAVTPEQINRAVDRMTPEERFNYRAEQYYKTRQGGFVDPGVFREGVKKIGSAYQQYVGHPLKEAIWRNPGQFGMAFAGGSLGWQSADADAPISEKMTRATVSALLAYGGAKGISKTPLGESFARNILDNYGLAGKFDSYIARKKLMTADRNELAAPFVEILKSIRGLNPADRKLLYNMLQGEATTQHQPLNLMNERVREQITDVGQKMVDAGLLPEDVFKKNVATYIHREYLSKMHPESAIAKKAVRAMKMIGDELKPRGYEKEVPVSQVQSGIGQGGTVKGKAYFNRSGQKVVRMRFQLTKAQREHLGEIEDAAYAIARTGRLMTNDLAVYRFYDDLSKNADIASDANPGGWVKVAEGKIPNTTINKYGNLEGKYVPREIYDDLTGLQRVRDWKQRPGIRAYLNMVSWWKVSKTALNPVVHVNNVVSNLVLYDLADADWKHIPAAIGQMRNNGEMFRAAKHLGVFDADYASQELRRTSTEMLDAYRDVAQATANPLETALNVARKTWGKTGGKMLDLYQWEDGAMRLAVFMDRVKKGMPPQQAAAEARRWFIDYDINAPWINALRHTATPFIAYTYRAVPLITEAAVLRPWKFAKWAAAGWALNELGAAYGGGDEAAERKLLADRDQGNIFGMPFFPPRMIKMPFQIDGKSQYLDVTRWIPGGDVLVSEENQFIPGAPSPLQPSFGPVGSIMKAGLGYDDWRGKKLPGLGLSNARDWRIKGEYLLKDFTPNFPGVPGAYSTEKIAGAWRGKSTPAGDVLPWWQATMQSFGIKLKPADLEKLVLRAQIDARHDVQALQDLAFLRWKDYQKGDITAKEYAESIKELQDEALQRIGKLQRKITKKKE